jgi:Flp pilus assembly protein TadD
LQGEGLALLLNGDLAASHRSLRAAVDAEPHLWRAWNGLGRYHDAGGRWQEAALAYQRALDAAPHSAVTMNNLGMSLLRQERYDEAAASFARALEVDPGLDAARTNLRLALAFQGRYTEALSGISVDERPRAFNNLGYVALLKGDHERAEAYFMRSLEASPSFYAPAWQNLELLASLEEMRNGGTRPRR